MANLLDPSELSSARPVRGCTIERISTLAQLDTLRSEWDSLLEAMPRASFFLTWEWVRSWWQYFGAGRDLWLLVARDGRGCLQGIAPLVLEKHRLGFLPVRVLTFIGSGVTYSMHLDFLAPADGEVETAQALIDYLLNEARQWDVLNLVTLQNDSPLHVVLRMARGRARGGLKTHAAYVPLPPSWETYHKTLKKSLRRNIKYFRSRLEGDYPGQVSFSSVTQAEAVPGAMQRLVEMNRARWHSKDRQSNFDDDNYAAFHQAVAVLGLERGWLRLNQLCVGEKPIATCYNYLFHRHSYAYAIGFDLEWSSYSPGRLSIASNIQQAIEQGAVEYDWLGGEEAYKSAWSDATRAETELLFSRTLPGHLWAFWRGFRADFWEAATRQARKHVPQSLRDRVNQWLAPKYNKDAAGGEEHAGEKEQNQE